MESDKKGIKFDSNKPDAYLLFQDFPRALKEISKLANMGAHKNMNHIIGNILKMENKGIHLLL